MRLGVTLWGFGLGYRDAVDLARQAEDAGFHNLFMVESVLSNDGVVTVAMMATRTSRLLIGTNIANVYLRHPVMLAAAAVAIDEVAPERLVLGLLRHLPRGPRPRRRGHPVRAVLRLPRGHAERPRCRGTLRDPPATGLDVRRCDRNVGVASALRRVHLGGFRLR